MTANKQQASTSQVVPVVSIPGYLIRAVLGKGGMATVYLATQESIKRDVALKILAPDHTDESFSERFVREALIVSKLAHPNIVTIYDAGVHAGYSYIAMEYIAGRNLVEAYTDLSYAQKFAVIKQIALALDCAGRKGYVHRDIKPENIMLTDDGRAILTDFGIARGHDVESGLTLAGRAIGTPYFMSPEQTKGQPVDHRSDIYSLGVVLFQALTGYVPYDGPSIVAIGIKHISAPVPTLPRFMDLLQPIIDRCMAKDPAQRYQTALELHDALAAISDAELDYIAAKARAMSRYNTHIHQAHTLSDTASVSIPADQRASRYAELSRSFRQPAARSTQQGASRKNPHRRSLIWLVLLVVCTLGVISYTKRNELQAFWTVQLQPLLSGYFGKYMPYIPVPAEPVQHRPLAGPAQDTSGIATNSPARDEPGLAEVRLQIRLLRDSLRINPDDTKSLQALNGLHAWYPANLEQALRRKDSIKARQLLSAYQADFSDTDKQYIAAYTQRIAGIEQVLQHLQQARVYMAANALDRPDGANALEEYLAALRLAPEDADVRAGLRDLARQFHDKALSAEQESHFTEALAHVASGLRATPDSPALKKLNDQLVLAIQNQRRYAELVQQADALLKQGHVIRPAKQNAYQLYTRVIEQDPHNRAALAGLSQVENWFVGQIRQLYEKQELFAARDMLTMAQDYFPLSQRYQVLGKEIETAIDATYPRISKVQFSPQGFTSMQSVTSLDKLNPGQTLYGGFAFQNFFDTGSLVEIRLTDQDGVIEYDRKNFSLRRRQGESFFELQLPQPGNPAGNYSVEFYLNEVRILRANLSGLH